MTRNEIRLAAAKKRFKKAQNAYLALAEAQAAALGAVKHKTGPRIRKASDAKAKAARDVAIAELACRGITPMKTIVEWRGQLFAVRIRPSGYDESLPVSKRTLRILGNRLPEFSNYRHAVVTDKVLAGADHD